RVEHDRAQFPRGEHLLRPQDGGGLDLVAGEQPRGRELRAVVDDEREVGALAVPDARGDPGRPEPLRLRDGHGATPVTGRPAVSGRSSARFMHWIAPPAVPLVRLSIAATTTSRPTFGSTVTCSCAVLAPSVDAVAGQVPSGSRCTNGSSA